MRVGEWGVMVKFQRSPAFRQLMRKGMSALRPMRRSKPTHLAENISEIYYDDAETGDDRFASAGDETAIGKVGEGDGHAHGDNDLAGAYSHSNKYNNRHAHAH
jgi:hypothetical protein